MKDMIEKLGLAIRALDQIDARGRHNMAAIVVAIDTMAEVVQKLDGILAESTEDASLAPHSIDPQE